ncbi:uncharacterized protein ACNLHF_024739 isoform 1-T2 [Anomaloglossus baeobatrachus]|uniref:uncharacterized protein LOC142246424 isoform X1 n=1 Tax=Anomaloglossus baeobatrachus TaxID=238106 RepID=UPI003F50A987
MGKYCSKPFLYEPSYDNLPELYRPVGRNKTVYFTSNGCVGPGVKKTLPSTQICRLPSMKQGEYSCKACRIMNAALEYNTGSEIIFGTRYRKDADFIELLLYRRVVPLDFIQGIKEDVQYKIPIQETSPDPRAGAYTYPIYDADFIELLLYRRVVPLDFIQGIKEDVQYKIPIQETSPDPRAGAYTYPLYVADDPKQRDGPTNFRFFRSKVVNDLKAKVKFQNSRLESAKIVLRKAFKNIFCCCTYPADEIEDDNSVYVPKKKDRKINAFGAGANIYFYGGTEDDFMCERIKKNNQYNPVGAGVNFDFPDELLSFPVQETSPVSAQLEDRNFNSINKISN